MNEWKWLNDDEKRGMWHNMRREREIYWIKETRCKRWKNETEKKPQNRISWIVNRENGEHWTHHYIFTHGSFAIIFSIQFIFFAPFAFVIIPFLLNWKFIRGSSHRSSSTFRYGILGVVIFIQYTLTVHHTPYRNDKTVHLCFAERKRKEIEIMFTISSGLPRYQCNPLIISQCVQKFMLFYSVFFRSTLLQLHRINMIFLWYAHCTLYIRSNWHLHRIGFCFPILFVF